MSIKLMILKVLIVDNTLADRKLYEMYVETTFKHVKAAYTHCSNARDAYMAIDQYKYDLALVEVSLLSRGFDTQGMAIVNAIRASEKNKDIAIIAFSNNSGHEEVVENAAIDAYIYKNDENQSPREMFVDKAPEALLKAADRAPKDYLLLLHNMGIIWVPDLET